jgi:hypothetical protein
MILVESFAEDDCMSCRYASTGGPRRLVVLLLIPHHHVGIIHVRPFHPTRLFFPNVRCDVSHDLVVSSCSFTSFHPPLLSYYPEQF